MAGKFDVKGEAGPYTDPIRPLNHIVFRLRKRRYDLGLSQTLVAHKLGYSVKTLKDWEAGLYSPKLDAAILWAETLGTTLDLPS